MRKRGILNYSIILLSIILLNCSSDQEIRHSYAVEEFDGVLTAVNKGGPKYSGELFVYEKLLEIQQDPDEPESLMTEGLSFIGEERGFYYVADYFDYRIVVFDSVGQYVRYFGGEGHGPGEFSQLWRVRGLEGDVINVFDMILRRTTLFRTDGSVLEVFSLPAIHDEGHVSSIIAEYCSPDGSYVVQFEPAEVRDNIEYSCARILTLSPESDTLGISETLLVPAGYLYTTSALGRGFFNQMPYAPKPVALYVPERGVLLSTGANSELHWHNLDGTIKEKISLDLIPSKVGQEEKVAYLARYDEDEGEKIVFPEVKAYWTDVHVDDAGFIWLRIPETAPQRELASRTWAYRLLTPQGEYLGVTRLPAEVEQIVGRKLLGLVTNPDTDEMVPTVWRLIPQAEGFVYP